MTTSHDVGFAPRASRAGALHSGRLPRRCPFTSCPSPPRGRSPAIDAAHFIGRAPAPSRRLSADRARRSPEGVLTNTRIEGRWNDSHVHATALGRAPRRGAREARLHPRGVPPPPRLQPRQPDRSALAVPRAPDQPGPDRHAQAAAGRSSRGRRRSGSACRSRCAADALGEPVEILGDEGCDDEFADACITAADYMRADGDW